jgi:hypothetical protein
LQTPHLSLDSPEATQDRMLGLGVYTASMSSVRRAGAARARGQCFGGHVGLLR